jgi:hypothetical protein
MKAIAGFLAMKTVIYGEAWAFQYRFVMKITNSQRQHDTEIDFYV